MFKNIKVWLCFIILTLFVGCASPNANKADWEIKLVISKDYGKKIISIDKFVAKEELSVMEILKDLKDIKTDKSGSYITSIDNLNEELDKTKTSGSSWFFYTNGKSSNVGLKDYYPKDKDIIIMDYHKWSFDETFKDTIDIELDK